MLSVFRTVFKQPLYVGVAALFTGAAFLFSVWLQNLKLIWQVLTLSSASLAAKLGFLASLVGSITTSFSAITALFIVINSFLLGVNVALIVYYFSCRKSTVKSAKQGLFAGFFGALGSIMGVGCAACGSLILTPLLALIGASGVLAVLPLAGGEFGILGTILLLVSIYLIVKKIQEPNICPVE